MYRKSIGDSSLEITSKMTPSKVVKILAKRGTIVSKEEAKIILEFMRRMAKITVSQYLRGIEKGSSS